MRWVLVLAMVCLIGVCTAEPKPVDGGWQRSDEVPAEIETPIEAPTDAPPEAEPSPIEPASPWFVWGVVGVTGLIGLALLGGWAYPRRRAKR